MNTMTMNPKIYELAVEIDASLQRIHGLLARLGAFDAPEDFHSARDLRMPRRNPPHPGPHPGHRHGSPRRGGGLGERTRRCHRSELPRRSDRRSAATD